MRPYLAIVSAGVRVMLQYRAAAAAGFATQLFWGWIRVAIFGAFYASSSATQPMSLEDTISYLWLTQALLLLLPFRLDSDLVAMIRDGTVAYELTRPADLYWYWFSRTLASRTAPMLLRAGPLLLVSGLFFGLAAPDSLSALAAFLVSVGAALLLSSAFTMLMSISLLWTIAGDGISRLISMIAQFLSGSYVPLPLFPQWAQPALALLPFAGLTDTPFRLYLGHLPLSSFPTAIAHQLLWTAVLVLVGRLALARGLRRMVVQGG